MFTLVQQLHQQLSSLLLVQDKVTTVSTPAKPGLDFADWLRELPLDLPSSCKLREHVLLQRCRERFPVVLAMQIEHIHSPWLRVRPQNLPTIELDLPELHWHEVGEIHLPQLLAYLEGEKLHGLQDSSTVGHLLRVHERALWVFATNVPQVFAGQQMRELQQQLQKLFADEVGE